MTNAERQPSDDNTSTAPPPIERFEQTFPVLPDAQIAELAALGTERSFEAGDCLWTVGDRSVDFFIVVEGTLEVVRHEANGELSVVVRLERGMYSGETATLSGRGAVVSARAGSALKVIAVPIATLKDLMVTHAALGETLIRSFILRRVRLIDQQSNGLLVVGSRHSASTLQLLEFLTRNAHPHKFVDLETSKGVCSLLDQFDIRPEDTPILITTSGEPLRNPTLRDVADRLGISPSLDRETVYDVAVVGAGPAGLASAVYAASEGLSVIVLDPIAPGGQAATSSKIENYLGFPTGISGQALAGRAWVQAQKFGATIAIPRRLESLSCGDPLHALELDSGERVRARTVVVASGARYRKPALANLATFEGNGVYYGATFLEAQYCKGQDVVVGGGGNSAGQAAAFLSQTAGKVYMLVRSEGLAASMSQYLIRRIETTPNIELLTRTEIVELGGETYLETVRWRDGKTGEETERAIRHLFLFTGATPNTDFLPEGVARDSKGFICTGQEVLNFPGPQAWTLERPPYLLETSCPGVFAAGDVRANSIKRVASAVGEGSVVIQFIHQLIGEVSNVL